MINRQQEKFLQELIKGGTQEHAYNVAYPNSLKWSSKVTQNKASALLKNPKVALRYAEIQHDAAEANAITRDAVLSKLKECAFAPWGTFKPNDQIRAMELICKIIGITSPQEED